MLLFLLACASDYGLDAVSARPGGPADVPAPRVSSGDEPAPVFVEVPVADDGGSAVSAEEDRVRGLRRETFVLGGGATTPVADFLFVIDESASMRKVVDRVRDAFASLAASGAFPAEARIAVTGMLPGDPADPTKVHPAANHRTRNRHDPGFLRLVSGATILDFLDRAPDAERANFADAGCDRAWFRPGDTNAAGVPCLVAHTQIAMDKVRVEAGLTTFEQLLEKQGDVPLFRPGAAANVIFVTDTQDPGLGPDAPELAELVKIRPDYATLAERVEEANTVASFRVHAIAPESECAEKWAHLGRVYQAAAEASGGRTLDVCTADDYRDFVRAIVRDGAVPQRAVVALGRAAEDAVVEVDGERVGWTASPDGRALVLDQALGTKPAHVTVEYTWKGAVKREAAQRRAPSPTKK